MAEPITSGTASVALGAVTLLALFPGLQAETVLGAFAGAVVFVLSAKDLSLPLKAAFWLLSMIAGVVCAATVAALMSSVLPSKVIVSSGVGALVAASVVIRLLLWLIRRAEAPDAALAEWRAKK